MKGTGLSEYSRNSELAKEWIVSSGIQNASGNDAGGFNSWYDITAGDYPYVYSEITGYGITTLLFLQDCFRADFLERAESAGEWIMGEAAHPSGGVKTRRYRVLLKEHEKYSFDSEIIYTFDCGMVLYGMVNLYKVSKKEKYLDFSKKLADFLLRDTLRGDGLFYASYNPSTGEKEDSDAKWSSQSGSYHAKLALGLIDLFEVTDNAAYRDAALRLSEGALKFQDKSGRFVTSRKDNSTHLHPHSYSAEGLLYAGLFFNRKDFIRSAADAVKWALDGQMPGGEIPKFFDGGKFVPYARTDIMAQTLRLATVVSGLGLLGGDYNVRTARLREKLLEFQYSGSDRQKGGFYYGFTLKGEKPAHLNSWCSMFALQALIMSERQARPLRGMDMVRCFV